MQYEPLSTREILKRAKAFRNSLIRYHGLDFSKADTLKQVEWLIRQCEDLLTFEKLPSVSAMQLLIDGQKLLKESK